MARGRPRGRDRPLVDARSGRRLGPDAASASALPGQRTGEADGAVANTAAAVAADLSASGACLAAGGRERPA